MFELYIYTYFRISIRTMKYDHLSLIIYPAIHPTDARSRGGGWIGWKTWCEICIATIDSVITGLCRRNSQRNDWPIDYVSDKSFVRSITFDYTIQLDSVDFFLIIDPISLYLFPLSLSLYFLANLAAKRNAYYTFVSR